MIIKTSMIWGLFTVMFTCIMAKMAEVLEKYVPLGYQDDSGFHKGPQPREYDEDRFPFSRN